MATKQNASRDHSGSSQEVRAPSTSLHVAPQDGRWVVRSGRSVTSIHATQAEAVVAARTIALQAQAEVVIHNRSGRVKLSSSPADDIMLEVWRKTYSAAKAGQQAR